MLVPEAGSEAPVQRCAEEEITFSVPVIQEEVKTVIDCDVAEIVGDLDRAYLDPDVGEKNVTVADASAGTEEVAAMAEAMQTDDTHD